MGSRSHYTYDGPIHRRRFLFALGSLNILDHLPIHAPRRGPGYEEGCAINEGHGGTQVTAAGNRHANRWLRSDYLCCASHGPHAQVSHWGGYRMDQGSYHQMLRCCAFWGALRFEAAPRCDAGQIRWVIPSNKGKGHGPRDQNV